MKRKAKLVRDGNSWSIRLPKQFLIESGIRSTDELTLQARPGHIDIYKTPPDWDKFEAAKKDARTAWDEAFEQVWIDIFGVE